MHIQLLSKNWCNRFEVSLNFIDIDMVVQLIHLIC